MEEHLKAKQAALAALAERLGVPYVGPSGIDSGTVEWGERREPLPPGERTKYQDCIPISPDDAARIKEEEDKNEMEMQKPENQWQVDLDE